MPDEEMIGQQILTKVDQLIEIIMATSLQEKEERQKQFEQGCLITRELLCLLEQIIGPRDDYLNVAVKELVNQRLPDEKILDRSSGFYDLLEDVCRVGRELYHYSQEEQNRFSFSKANQVSQKFCNDPIEQALYFLFPRAKIHKNYLYRGLKFKYYLPSVKLAIEDIAQSKKVNSVRKEFFCRRDGIKLIRLDLCKKVTPREIARFIKKQISICVDRNGFRC